MPLSHEHVGSKIPAKIYTYMLTRAELLFNLCYEIPCIYLPRIFLQISITKQLNHSKRNINIKMVFKSIFEGFTWCVPHGLPVKKHTEASRQELLFWVHCIILLTPDIYAQNLFLALKWPFPVECGNKSLRIWPKGQNNPQ